MSESGDNKGYLPRHRFNQADDFNRWRSPYQFDSEELNILQKEGIGASYTELLTLSTAQSPVNPYLLGTGGVGSNNPSSQGVGGRGFRFVGLTTATAYSFQANIGIETNVSTAIIGCWINKIGGPSDAIFIKHGGGFRGDFLKLYLFWPAQSSNSGRITIYRYDGVPWQSGDAST
jgi:hypothetical protein